MSETPHNALGSVRQLEGALDVTARTRAASELRIERAHSAAALLLAAAREDAAAAAAERRRVVLAAVEEEAAEISRRGAETAARVQSDARISCAKVVEAALALVLMSDGKGEV